VWQGLGARIEVMPTDGAGCLDLAATGARIDGDLAAICAPMVCSLTGERYPVEALGALPRPESTFYVVDVSQALGQMPVDMQRIGADIVADLILDAYRLPQRALVQEICLTPTRQTY